MDWTMLIFLGVFIVIIVIMGILSKKKNKQQQDSYTTMINSLEKGDKVYLISRLVGYVVKVETTITGEKYVTVETGLDDRKSTLTFDVQAIHAVLEKHNAPKPVQEAPVQEEKEKIVEKTDDLAVVAEPEAAAEEKTE